MTVVAERPLSAPDREPSSTRRPALVTGALVLIRLYQGLRAGRPSPCRYLPTCSAYAAEALERYGMVRGSRLALRRVLRCHPWGGSGHDPVPELGGQS